MLYSTDEHHHHENKEKAPQGISPLVQRKIIEFESYGLKPAQIMIQLRKFADILPSKCQLSNFLNFHRNKVANIGSSGTQIKLNDFIDMYEKYKQIPEDLDQLFIPDCFVNSLMEGDELVSIFRIFFTTKRLLSFSKYVSVNFI